MRKHRSIFGLSLLLMVGTAHALTLSQIETRIRQQVRDTATSTSLQRYSDTFLDDQINEGQRDVINQMWCLDGTTGYMLVTGTTFYSLPTDYMAAKFVRFKDSSNNTLILEEKNERSFIQNNPDWQKQTGKPVNYFVRTSTSSGTSYEIAYYPIPTTSSTGTITIDYYKTSTDMTSDSDVPFDGILPLIPYHNVLADYVTARIKVIEGKVEEATFYGNLYNAGLESINSKFGARPNWTPSFSGSKK